MVEYPSTLKILGGTMFLIYTASCLILAILGLGLTYSDTYWKSAVFALLAILAISLFVGFSTHLLTTIVSNIMLSMAIGLFAGGLAGTLIRTLKR